MLCKCFILYYDAAVLPYDMTSEYTTMLLCSAVFSPQLSLENPAVFSSMFLHSMLFGYIPVCSFIF